MLPEMRQMLQLLKGKKIGDWFLSDFWDNHKTVWLRTSTVHLASFLDTQDFLLGINPEKNYG